MEKDIINTHRGKILHEAAKLHPSSIKEIVKATGYKYGTFFKHIEDAHLSYMIIAKYGMAMHKDFSVEFPEMAELPSIVIPANSGKEQSLEQLRLENQELHKKYSALFEKYHAQFEELILLKSEMSALKQEKRNGNK